MCTITFSKSHRSTDITADSLWKSLFNRRMLCLYPKLLAILVHYQVYFFKQKFGLDWGPWHFCLILYIAFHVFLAKEEKALIYYVYKSSHSCSLAKFKFGQTWKQYKFAYSCLVWHILLLYGLVLTGLCLVAVMCWLSPPWESYWLGQLDHSTSAIYGLWRQLACTTYRGYCGVGATDTVRSE